MKLLAGKINRSAGERFPLSLFDRKNADSNLLSHRVTDAPWLSVCGPTPQTQFFQTITFGDRILLPLPSSAISAVHTQNIFLRSPTFRLKKRASTALLQWAVSPAMTPRPPFCVILGVKRAFCTMLPLVPVALGFSGRCFLKNIFY